MIKLFDGIYKLTLGNPEPGTPATRNYVKVPDLTGLAEIKSTGTLPFEETQITFETTRRGCTVELPLSSGEDIYGLGLQLKSIRHTGKKRTLRVNSDPVADTGDSHAPAPIYFSTKGYAVMVDTARYATFYCGGNRPLDMVKPLPETQKIALSEEELYRAKTEAVAPMVIDVPGAAGIELYFFAGDSLLEAMRRYVLFCGGGCLPPEWGLGVWYRACGTADQENVAAVAKELRQRQIPCDVLGLEPGWQSRAYSCSFVWSPERFGDHERLVQTLIQDGFHLNLWEHAFVHPEAPFYEKLKPYSGDFAVWGGLVPDFSVTAAADIFKQYHQKNFTARGISSFKLDECDNSDFISSPWSFPECSHFPSGADGEEMHSLFGMHYMTVIDDACTASGSRTYGSVRNAHLFAPPLPFVLYSDLYDHRDFIRGVGSAAFSGMLWVPELRHAANPADYLRRIEAMILSPQMVFNIWSMPHPPWRQLQRDLNIAGVFFSAEEENYLCGVTRKLTELRMSLVPYLYSAFARYRFAGVPPFRPPVMDYPDEPALRGVDDAWLAGENLLTVPFTAADTEKTVRLPPGGWYDFDTGERFEHQVTLRPGLETLPILVRENSVIPFAAPVQFIKNTMKYQLQLRLYGKHPRPAHLYSDDGFSLQPDRRHWGTVDADGNLSGNLSDRYEISEIVRISQN